jgi:hypothetical protein
VLVTLEGAWFQMIKSSKRMIDRESHRAFVPPECLCIEDLELLWNEYLLSEKSLVMNLVVTL